MRRRRGEGQKDKKGKGPVRDTKRDKSATDALSLLFYFLSYVFVIFHLHYNALTIFGINCYVKTKYLC